MDDYNVWTHGSDGGLCWGDSGGALMVEGGNALLGVLSDFDDVFDCHAGNAMIFTSTYGERDFLARAIRCADSTDAACMTSCTYECSNYGYVEGQCYQGWTCTDACLVSSGTCSN